MPETTDKVTDALKLQADVDALIERAKAAGLGDGVVPDELRDAADAARTLDAPRTSRIAKTLSLAETAGEAAILAAIEDLRKPVALEALAARADDLGKVLLDTDAHAQLQRDAEAGRKAAGELKEQTFTLAWDKAMFEGRVDAKAETKVLYREMFDRDADLAVRFLATAPKLVNVAPAATPVEVEHEAGDEDDDTVRLEKAKQYQAANPNTDLVTALEAVS